MKKNIITAADAREISLANESVGFNSIMDRIKEYAAQGKQEFEVRNKPLLKQWETELIKLGYTLTKKENFVWILSWDNAKSCRFSHLPKNDTPTYIDLRLMRNAITGLSEGGMKYSIKDLIDLAIKKNIVIGESEV